MSASVNATPPLGRRERKKQATRRALQDAALDLALEHGPEQVTVEAICVRADVAPRTFFNYFAGKDDAMAGDGVPLPDEATWQEFEAGGTGDLWEDLRVILFASARELAPRREEFLRRRTLLERCPGLLHRHLGQIHRFEDRMVRAIAVRSATDPEKDVYPELVAGFAAMAMKVSIRRWARGKGGRSPQAYLDETFDVLRETLESGR